jgi:hypothetical protein
MATFTNQQARDSGSFRTAGRQVGNPNTSYPQRATVSRAPYETQYTNPQDRPMEFHRPEYEGARPTSGWSDGNYARNVQPVANVPPAQRMPQARPAGYHTSAPQDPYEGLGPRDVYNPQTRQFEGPQQAQAMPRSRPPSGTAGTGGGVPEGWSNARERAYLADRRVRQGVADAGVHNGPRRRPVAQARPQNLDRTAPYRRNVAPRPRARPAYDNRYGRPGSNNPPYPSMNDSHARQMDAARADRGGAHRAFEARYDSGRYTPQAAAAGVDRQYGRTLRPNDPGYAESMARGGGSRGGGGGNAPGGPANYGRPDNYGRYSVSGGGSFNTSPSPNRN